MSNSSTTPKTLGEHLAEGTFPSWLDEFTWPYEPPQYHWAAAKLKEGDVAMARSKDGSKTILFASYGEEAVDMEIARRAGIDEPDFGSGKLWLRLHRKDGFVPVQGNSLEVLGA